MTLIHSITLSPENVTVTKGKWYYGLSASICPTDATCKCLTWHSSNANVASVNQSGHICGVSEGAAVIYATAQDGSGAVGFCNVTVEAPTLVRSISVTPTEKALTVGETLCLSAFVCPTDADDKRIRWSSCDCNIADVDYLTGCVTAKAIGSTFINANAVDGSGVCGSCEVTVNERNTGSGNYYNIINSETGKVVNISGSYLVELSDEKNITLYSKSGSNEQVWEIDTISDSEPCYIKSYVDPEYGFNAYRSPSNNYNCNIHKIMGNETDAAVYFIPQTDGSYKIKLANHSNYYLTATGSSDGSDIRWQPEDSAKNQKWKLEIADFTEREAIATAVVEKVQSCSTDLIPSDKKTACVTITQAMLNLGYPVSFVAGMLANIVFEGSTGQFENSNYDRNPEKKKDYLIYMDTEYNGTNFYLNNYSNRTIMEVGVDSTYNMLCDLKNQSNGTWKIGSSRVGFGLGCIQWSFARTLDLVNAYRKINNCSNDITMEQACQGEALLMLKELAPSNIVSSWKKNNAAALSSETAAYNAAKVLCESYSVPDNYVTVAITRANRAASIYSAIAM